MKILILASKTTNVFSPFVIEQGEELRKAGVEVEFLGVSGKGIISYLQCRKKLINRIKEFNPDIIHAHYGLCGLLANLQRRKPVITTYHGSDIHSKKWVLFLSKLAMLLSNYNIFVGESLYKISGYKGRKYSIISCGLNLSVVKPINFYEARKLLGWDNEGTYALFAGSFNNEVKNSELAKRSVEMLEGCQLVEMKGYSRQEVALLMSACDLLLTTSIRESGPLVVKEAMACNRPIVTTKVGDTKWVIGDTEGCYFTSYNVEDCARQIKKAIKFSMDRKSTNGRKRILELGLDNTVVAQKIISIYRQICKK